MLSHERLSKCVWTFGWGNYYYSASIWRVWASQNAWVILGISIFGILRIICAFYHWACLRQEHKNSLQLHILIPHVELIKPVMSNIRMFCNFKRDLTQRIRAYFTAIVIFLSPKGPNTRIGRNAWPIFTSAKYCITLIRRGKNWPHPFQKLQFV